MSCCCAQRTSQQFKLPSESNFPTFEIVFAGASVLEIDAAQRSSERELLYSAEGTPLGRNATCLCRTRQEKSSTLLSENWEQAGALCQRLTAPTINQPEVINLLRCETLFSSRGREQVRASEAG